MLNLERLARYLVAACVTIFESEAARKRALDACNAAYSLIREEAHSVSISYANSTPRLAEHGPARNAHFEAHDLPYDLHQVRDRHIDVIGKHSAMNPSGFWGAHADTVRDLVTLRASIKAAAITPKVKDVRTPVWLDNTNPITRAVMPSKDAAVQRAREHAEQFVAHRIAELEAPEVNWNLDIIAPSPHYNLSRAEYMKAANKRAMYSSLTERTWTTRSRGEPDMRRRSPELEVHFVQIEADGAAAQYDAFVAKLVDKVGECTDASLEGSHVWGHSYLTVTKPDGTTQVWKTHQIVNVSVLGKVFNQWPTRRMS